MKLYLPLKPNQRYALITDAITRYYPIGVKSDLPAYNEYPGQVELGEIIVGNIHNSKNFKVQWRTFEKELRAASKRKVHGETYAIRPCFSAKLVIKKKTLDELVHLKTLYFSVSLIGPFYTIFGVDETSIKDERDGHEVLYSNINIVTVSPFKEFETDFNFIKNKIEERFVGYRFVPFKLHSMYIDGLYDMYSGDEATIYKALFDDRVDGYDTLKMRGDSMYGFDKWPSY